MCTHDDCTRRRRAGTALSFCNSHGTIASRFGRPAESRALPITAPTTDVQPGYQRSDNSKRRRL